MAGATYFADADRALKHRSEQMDARKRISLCHCELPIASESVKEASEKRLKRFLLRFCMLKRKIK